MALSLDERIDEARVRKFASQMANVPENIRIWFEETFSGEHSLDFYEGLLSAYANMNVMVQSLKSEQLKEYSGPIVSFVANELRKRYDSQR